MSQKTTQHTIVAIFKQFEQCNRLHDTSKPLFFDTETTGGGRADQIIEMAFCDISINLIIYILIYTNRPSSTSVWKVYGIHPYEWMGRANFTNIQVAM